MGVFAGVAVGGGAGEVGVEGGVVAVWGVDAAEVWEGEGEVVDL